MQSKLNRYALAVMEAAWLAAVILIPVFFNVYSSRIFEPDKITLLRTLALVTLAAWIVAQVEGRQAGGGEPLGVRIKAWLRRPLVLPVVGLAAVYLLATAFSVTPAISLWGSYQRLQGLYTTLAYLVIFMTMATTLREWAQVERLMTAVIVASLPVALYGVLQRYNLDPIPWGGDVSVRIAANMGNSIFIAAYMIMAFPLTVGRIVRAFQAILKESGRLAAETVRATFYIFIGALQVIALYMSGSRGPVMGWLAGLFVTALLFSLLWRKRALAAAVVGAALVVGAFLFALNIEGGPLENLRSAPAVGRFSRLLDPESSTALVRKYIWEGAAELVLPHEPINFPDGGQDTFNFLRPLIGYGPESMYVAYNPFYPTALGTVERRNASPDRAHNETWDSLVITGFLGLVAYLAVFTAVFYYGLKWLGLLATRRRKLTFFALYFGAGLAGAVGMALWRGFEFAGLGLPFGLLGGLLATIALEALFPNTVAPQTTWERVRFITLTVLLAAVASHFIEINFGIAIVSTRTYFWVYSALLLVVGYILPARGELEALHFVQPGAAAERSGGRSSRKRRQAAGGGWTAAWETWLREGVQQGTVLAIVLIALGFNYLTNSRGGVTAWQILSKSLTEARSGDSLGLVALLFTTWLVGAILLSVESRYAATVRQWLKILGGALASALVLAGTYYLIHASGLAAMVTTEAGTMEDVLRQVGRYEQTLTRFYGAALLLLFGLAYLLVDDWPARGANKAWAAYALAPALLVAALWTASTTNLRVIQADIAFKLAEPFARQGSWPAAIGIYRHANELAPSEDYYYLFLGRAYIEYAKTLDDPAQRDLLVQEAERDLLAALEINPLNTDHTANLGRLYSLWASLTNDEQLRRERAEKASEYFRQATTLSPNNARLYGEWALVYLNVLQDYERAYAILQQALEVDPDYDWTYALLGDFYARTIPGDADDAARQAALETAASYYSQALEVFPRSRYNDRQNKFSYLLALGSVFTQLQQRGEAIAMYQESLDLAPSDSERWRIEEALGRLFLEQNDLQNAVLHYQRALETAPPEQRERLQAAIAELTAP